MNDPKTAPSTKPRSAGADPSSTRNAPKARRQGAGQQRFGLRRIAPFLRRDLRPRLLGAGITALLIAALCVVGVSALAGLDNEAGHQLRTRLGLEAVGAVCGGLGQSPCSYDDRAQAEADRRFEIERRLRAAVLTDLELRVEDRLMATLEAREHVRPASRTSATDLSQFIESAEIRRELQASTDLRPLATPERELKARGELVAASRFDPTFDEHLEDTRERFLSALDLRIEQLEDDLAAIERQRAREREPWVDRATASRVDVWSELWGQHDLRKSVLVPAHATTKAVEDGPLPSLANWLAEAGGQQYMSANLAALLRHDPATTAAAVFDPDADLWHGAWTDPTRAHTDIRRPSLRYRSPLGSQDIARLLGAALIGFAALFWLVVAPVCTATATAREREAGTLPVLRMTGLGGGDLALAMTVGSNVFALTAGSLLLIAGALLTAWTSGLAALALPLGLLAAFTLTTNLTAVTVGDALGQRVNALVVGGATAAAILLPGVVGAALVAFDAAGTGALLGPLPAVGAAAAGLAQVEGVGLVLEASEHGLGAVALVYALLSQVLLATVCLASWLRRVEHTWAPLLRPRDGVLLSLLCVGASALGLLDVAARVQAQSFDQVNLLTLLASAYLLPVLGWLLVASLRRPARAGSTASHVEARRALLRFHLVLAGLALTLGGAYWLVLGNTGLRNSNAELMWATLTQVLLAFETAVATGLLVSRRRQGRGRTIAAGAVLVALQLVSAGVTYGLEVDFVARTNSPGLPLMVGMGASPYWVAFLLLLWTAGIVMILMAIMRENEAAPAPEAGARDSAVDDDGLPGRRLIH